MLSDAGQFLSSLENYDKDNLTEDMIKKLKVYVENPNFKPEKVMHINDREKESD